MYRCLDNDVEEGRDDLDCNNLDRETAASNLQAATAMNILEQKTSRYCEITYFSFIIKKHTLIEGFLIFRRENAIQSNLSLPSPVISGFLSTKASFNSSCENHVCSF